MTKIVWDAVASRVFETGVDRGVLYLPYEDGIPWNGLVSVSESSDGGELTPYYRDGQKYVDFASNESYQATIEAFTYPIEFEKCLGVQPIQGGMFATAQPRLPFALSYRTKLGNDVTSTDFGYKLHIVYNATASVKTRAFKSISDSPEATTFAYDIAAVPVVIPGRKPAAHIVVDSRETTALVLGKIEDVLYGTGATVPKLPTVTDLLDILTSGPGVTITDNGDGTWTARGPASVITTSGTSFDINPANATFLDANTYKIASTP